MALGGLFVFTSALSVAHDSYDNKNQYYESPLKSFELKGKRFSPWTRPIHLYEYPHLLLLEIKSSSHPEVNSLIKTAHQAGARVLLVRSVGLERTIAAFFKVSNYGQDKVVYLHEAANLSAIYHEFDHLIHFTEKRRSYVNSGISPSDADRIALEWLISPPGVWELEESAVQVELQLQTRIAKEGHILRDPLPLFEALPHLNVWQLLEWLTYPELTVLNFILKGMHHSYPIENESEIREYIDKLARKVAFVILEARRKNENTLTKMRRQKKPLSPNQLELLHKINAQLESLKPEVIGQDLRLFSPGYHQRWLSSEVLNTFYRYFTPRLESQHAKLKKGRVNSRIEIAREIGCEKML